MNTKKDFIATAEIISTIENLGTRAMMALMMAKKYSDENPRFNRQKFYKACNLPYTTMKVHQPTP